MSGKHVTVVPVVTYASSYKLSFPHQPFFPSLSKSKTKKPTKKIDLLSREDIRKSSESTETGDSFRRRYKNNDYMRYLIGPLSNALSLYGSPCTSCYYGNNNLLEQAL